MAGYDIGAVHGSIVLDLKDLASKEASAAISEMGAAFAGLQGKVQNAESAGSAFSDRFASDGSAILGVLGNIASMAGTAVVVGFATAATGAALLGTNIAKAGIEYNTLMQKSGAALTTLLGTREAADEMIAAVMEFASSSPFPRQAFIAGTQQMIGFGIEASKVVPYLGAIQDGVAAVGGSTDDLSRMIGVFSNIQSAGKITGEDLMIMGTMGVNAAQLIGDQMGVTANDIKDSISEGAIDAETALTALTNGMNAKFGGAAANLKETWIGATDRIKGSMRDLGSVIVEPFIAKKGGGYAVLWANQLATTFRGIIPIAEQAMGALTKNLEGTFSNISKALFEVNLRIRGMSFDSIVSGAKELSRYLPIAAGALAGLATASGLPGLSMLAGVLGPAAPLIVGLAVMASTIPQVRRGVSDLARAMEPLGSALIRVGAAFGTTLTGALAAAGTLLSAIAPVVETLASAFEALPLPIQMAAVALVALNLAMRAGVFNNAITGVTRIGGAFQTLTADARRAYAAGLSPMSSALVGVGNVAGAAVGGVKRLGGALLGAFGGPIGLAITAVGLGIAAWAGANAEAEAKVAAHKNMVDDLKGSLDQTTGALTEASRVKQIDNLIADGTAERLAETGVAMSDFVQGMEKGTQAARSVENRLATMAGTAVESAVGMSSAERAVEELGVSMQDMVLAAHGNEEALGRVKTAQEGSTWSAKELESALKATADQSGVNGDMLDKLYEQQEAHQAAKLAIDLQNQSMRDIRDSQGEAGVTAQEFAAALAVVSDDAADATSKLAAYRTMLDILNGGTRTQLELDIALSKNKQNLADAFAAATDEAGNFNTALVNADGSLNVGTEAGVAFAESLTAISDEAFIAADSAAKAASAAGKDNAGQYDAAVAAMQPYIDSFTETAKAAGLGDAEIAGMIQTIFGIPEQVASAIVFGGADQAQSDMLMLLGMLNDIDAENPEVIVTALTDESRAQLESLGFTIENLEDGTFKITGDAAAADAEIDRINASIDATDGKTAEVDIKVTDNDETAKIQGEIEELLATAGEGETVEISVEALTQEARAELEALGYTVEEQRDGSVTITGTTSGVKEAKEELDDLDGAIANGSGSRGGRSVTVHGQSNGVKDAKDEVDLLDDATNNINGKAFNITGSSNGVDTTKAAVDGVEESRAKLDSKGFVLNGSSTGVDTTKTTVDGLKTSVDGMANKNVNIPVSAPGADTAQTGMNGFLTALTTTFTQGPITAQTGTSLMSTAVNGFLTPLAGLATTAFTGFMGGVQQGMTGSNASVTSNTSAMASSTSSNMGKMTSTASSSMGSFSGTVQSGGQRANSSMGSSMGSMVGTVASNMGRVVGQIASSMGQFVGGIASGVGQAAGAMAGGIGRIVGAASSGVGQMMSIGQNMGGALAAGIQSMVGTAVSAANQIAQAAANAAASAAKIKSPSRVWRNDLGQMMGRGLELGLLDKVPAVMKAANRLATAPSLSGGLFGMPDSVGSYIATAAAGNIAASTGTNPNAGAIYLEGDGLGRMLGEQFNAWQEQEDGTRKRIMIQNAGV